MSNDTVHEFIGDSIVPLYDLGRIHTLEDQAMLFLQWNICLESLSVLYNQLGHTDSN